MMDKGVDPYWKVGGRASKSWQNISYITGPKYHSAHGPSEKKMKMKKTFHRLFAILLFVQKL